MGGRLIGQDQTRREPRRGVREAGRLKAGAQTRSRRRRTSPLNRAVQVPPISPKTFEGARRHSRFVRLMKLVLPLAAFAIAAALGVLMVIYQPDDSMTVTFSDSPTLQNDRRMLQPTFSGSLPDGQDFRLHAESAEHSPDSTTRVMLTSLNGEMRLKDETGVTLQSARGLLELDDHRVSLFGDVTVRSDHGYVLRTEKVLVNIEEHSVQGDQPVEAEGPMGTVRADRFLVENNGETVRFEGSVVMTIRPDAVDTAMDQAEG